MTRSKQTVKETEPAVREKLAIPMKKKYRRNRVLSDIRKLQRNSKLAMNKGPFGRLVRELVQDMVLEFSGAVRWQNNAITALQIETERFLVNMFVTANFNRMAITDSKRATLKVCDIVTAIRGDNSNRQIFDIYLAKHMDSIYSKNALISSISKNERSLDSKKANLEEKIANKAKIIEAIKAGDTVSLSKAKRYASTIRKRETLAASRAVTFADVPIENTTENAGTEDTPLVNKRKKTVPKKRDSTHSEAVIAADI